MVVYGTCHEMKRKLSKYEPIRERGSRQNFNTLWKHLELIQFWYSMTVLTALMFLILVCPSSLVRIPYKKVNGSYFITFCVDLLTFYMQYLCQHYKNLSNLYLYMRLGIQKYIGSIRTTMYRFYETATVK